MKQPWASGVVKNLVITNFLRLRSLYYPIILKKLFSTLTPDSFLYKVRLELLALLQVQYNCS